MSEKQQAERVLEIRFEQRIGMGDPCLYTVAHVVELHPGRDVRPVHDTWDSKHMFSHLALSAHAFTGMREPNVRELPGCGSLEYHECYRIDADQAARMAATFGMVERKLAKLAERFGSPSGFPEHVARLADVLGIKTVVYRHQADGPAWCRGNLELMTVHWAITWLSARFADWVENGRIFAIDRAA